VDADEIIWRLATEYTQSFPQHPAAQLTQTLFLFPEAPPKWDSVKHNERSCSISETNRFGRFGPARLYLPKSLSFHRFFGLARELQSDLRQEDPAMLAVPLHGNDVAPRFCSADRFLIAELDGGQARCVRRLTISEATWAQCLERLSAAGVSVLLCGGFNHRFLPLAGVLGIRVISGLAGEAEQLIDAFARDEIEKFRFLPCRGRHKGRRGANWPRQPDPQELRGRKEAEPCRDTTEPVRSETDRARGEAWAVAAERLRERDS
jgi:predicted Fe-Mo cluster-binding NifX family protein